MDGVFVSAGRRKLELLSPGRLAGQGVFETMRAHQGKIVQREEHLARLFKGLRILKIQPAFTKQEIRKNLSSLLCLNPLFEARHAPSRCMARIRLLVWLFRGVVHTAIVAVPYRPFSLKKYRKGFKVLVAPRRLNRSPRLAFVKSIQYGVFLKGYQSARERGFDEAIFLDRHGFLVEGSRGNLFFVKGRILFTPPLSCGCLSGITRWAVIKIARRLGLRVKEVPGRVQELLKAEEAFLTNSLMGVMPVSRVNSRAIGTGKAGATTLRILKCYQKMSSQEISITQ